MDLITLYLRTQSYREEVPNQYAEFRVSFRLVEWRLKSTELIDETSKRPDVRLGVISFFLHEFW